MGQSARLHVLLAEDSQDDVILTRRAFKRAGVEVDLHICAHGEAAIAYLAGQGDYGDRARYPLPALMLLDWKLPRRNGFEVLTWLQQQSGKITIPVVVVSSSNLHVDIEQALTAGAFSYVQKPLNAEMILNVLGSLQLPMIE